MNGQKHCCTKPSTCVDACATLEAQHPCSRRWPCSTTTGATGSAAVHLAEARALRHRTGTEPPPILHEQLSRVARSLAASH